MQDLSGQPFNAVVSRRETTKALTALKHAERAKREEEEKKRREERRAQKERDGIVEHRMTQEELLEEAKETEEANRKSLETLLKLEEEKKAVVHTKSVPKGARIVYHSKGNSFTYTFTDNEVPACINTKAAEPGPNELLGG